MNAAGIIEKLDILSEKMDDAELLLWLEGACASFEAEHPDDDVGAAALFNELGGICRRNGWYERGEKAFLRAKEGLERSGVADGNYATTLNNLAGLYRLSGDFERSAEYFSRCRELYETMTELPVDVLASVCNNLGLLHLDAGRYGEALEEFAKAEAMIAAIPENAYVHAVTAGNSGFAHFRLGDRTKAAEMMLRAARFARGIDDGGEMQRNYMSLYHQLGGKEE